jgi:hypothetical protein
MSNFMGINREISGSVHAGKQLMKVLGKGHQVYWLYGSTLIHVNLASSPGL